MDDTTFNFRIWRLIFIGVIAVVFMTSSCSMYESKKRTENCYEATPRGMNTSSMDYRINLECLKIKQITKTGE